MKTESVCSFSVSVHMSVEFPGTDTLIPTQIAGDVLGSVLGQQDRLRRYEMFSTRVVDPVGSAQVRLQVSRQLGVGRE